MEPQGEELKDNSNLNNTIGENKERKEENENLLKKYEQDKVSNDENKSDQQKEIEKQKKYEFVRDERKDTQNQNQNVHDDQNMNENNNSNYIHDENRDIEINNDELNELNHKNPNEWSNENVKKWIQFKKSLGTNRDKNANTEEYEKRDGKSLFEILKSRETFKSYSGNSNSDKSFASVLFDDLKERVDIFYRKDLFKSIVSKIVEIKITRKRVLWQPEINYSIGLRVGSTLILTSNDHLNNFNEKNTTIEIGFSDKWYKGTLLDISDPMEQTDCALLKINDLNEECETFPILENQYILNSEIFYFDIPISRSHAISSSKDKNSKDNKPLEPSIFTGRISYFNENNLEVHLNGSDINEFNHKSRLFFSCKKGELCGIIRKKSQYLQYLNSNVLYCTKISTLKAWVDTTLKRFQNPPLWE